MIEGKGMGTFEATLSAESHTADRMATGMTNRSPGTLYISGTKPSHEALLRRVAR